MTDTNLEEIKIFAIKSHQGTNHTYGDKPYSYHLEMVVAAVLKYINHIPEEDRNTVIAAAWCHDLIEDCRITYNDLVEQVGKEVAEIVYALTNDKGRNRSERASASYYKGIRDTKYAVFIKLCDRLANVKNSKYTGNKMFVMYRKEHVNFIVSLTTDTGDFKNKFETEASIELYTLLNDN